MIFAVLIAATVLLVVFTLLPIWRYEAWWVRSLDFPRFQLSIILLIIIGFELVLLDFSLLSSWMIVMVAVALPDLPIVVDCAVYTIFPIRGEIRSHP